MYRFKSIIFDLDGTIIDTAPGLALTMNHILDEHGRPQLSLEDVRPHVSFGARAIMKHAFEATGEGADEEMLDKMFEQFLPHYMENMANVSEPFPGLAEALEALRETGAELGVCTNRHEASAKHLLDALGLAKYFSAIIGQDTYGIAKPDPLPLIETVKLCGGGALPAILVGDSEVDIATARAANMPVIAVSFGYAIGPADQLGADYVIDHFDELAGAIKTLA